jgi:hypothetical protein
MAIRFFAAISTSLVAVSIAIPFFQHRYWTTVFLIFVLVSDCVLAAARPAGAIRVSVAAIRISAEMVRTFAVISVSIASASVAIRFFYRRYRKILSPTSAVD